MEENNSLLEVNDHDKFLTNYKAVYQAMTAKNDCRSKIFPRDVKIKLDDIYDLNDRIVEKLKNCDIQGFSMSITANFKGRQTIDFSSWNEFENHKWNESEAVIALTIVWEFNVLLPKYKIPQKHLLVVKMTDGLRPEEMLNIVFAGKLENMDEIEKQVCPVVARVDFINYILGDELLRIVEEWDKGLPIQSDSENKIVHKAKKQRRKLAFIIQYITDIIYIYFAIRLFNFVMNSFEIDKLSEFSVGNMEKMVWIFGILIVAFIFFNRIAQWLANMLYMALGEETETHVFDINKGDSNLQEKLKKENERTKMSVVLSIIGTIIINLVCGLVVTLITK